MYDAKFSRVAGVVLWARGLHGLLAPSFVPLPPIRSLRLLIRYRMQLMGDRTRERIRVEMMFSGCQHQTLIASSLVDGLGQGDPLAAMIAGERDPLVLAEMAKGKMRGKIPDLTKALPGTFRRSPCPVGGVDFEPARSGGTGVGGG